MCLGVVPCALPPCRPAAGERAVGVVELGASGIRMALRQGMQASPVRATDSTCPQKLSPSEQALTSPLALTLTISPSDTWPQAKVAAHWPIPS